MYEYQAQIDEVVDGDTIDVVVGVSTHSSSSNGQTQMPQVSGRLLCEQKRKASLVALLEEFDGIEY